MTAGEGGYKRTCVDDNCRSNSGEWPCHIILSLQSNADTPECCRHSQHELPSCRPHCHHGGHLRRRKSIVVGARTSTSARNVVVSCGLHGARCYKKSFSYFGTTCSKFCNWCRISHRLCLGESLEDACRREVFEESGIKVGRVDYHSSQTWPSPTSLMLGCVAHALSEEVRVDREELEDARWFTRREILQMLTNQHPEKLFCPPPSAIAHHLIKAFVSVAAHL